MNTATIAADGVGVKGQCVSAQTDCVIWVRRLSSQKEDSSQDDAQQKPKAVQDRPVD